MLNCVSQIAWKPEEHTQALLLLETLGITGIEIAPSMLFAKEEQPFKPSAQVLRTAKTQFQAHGLRAKSMQALLTGCPQAQMFGSKAERQALNQRIEDCLIICEALNIPHIVFGSPKQRRVPDTMTQNEAHDITEETLALWNELGKKNNTFIGLECNPPLYGGNWWTEHETLTPFLTPIRPFIKMTLDIGAIIATNTDVNALYTTWKPYIFHCHLSVPNLLPPTRNTIPTNVQAFLDKENLPISLEMARPPNGLEGLEDIILQFSKKESPGQS